MDPIKIQRYELAVIQNGPWKEHEMVYDDEGFWVRYVDHIQGMNDLKKRIAELEALVDSLGDNEYCL